MNRIFVTGDTHRTNNYNKIRKFGLGVGSELTKDDIMIILGDFGALWHNENTEGYRDDLKLLDWYDTECKWTTVVVLGNHENYDIIEKIPVTEMFGGKVRIVNNSVILLERGETYKINGKSFLAIGGGGSIDKKRRIPHISWWKQEVIVQGDIDNALHNVAESGYLIDYVISHACPKEYFNLTTMFKEIDLDNSPSMLQQVFDKVTFDCWLFGHYHQEHKIDNFVCLFNTIIELGEYE